MAAVLWVVGAIVLVLLLVWGLHRWLGPLELERGLTPRQIIELIEREE